MISLMCGILKEKKKIKVIETVSRKVVARGWVVGEIGEVAKRVQPFRYKMTKV